MRSRLSWEAGRRIPDKRKSAAEPKLADLACDQTDDVAWRSGVEFRLHPKRSDPGGTVAALGVRHLAFCLVGRHALARTGSRDRNMALWLEGGRNRCRADWFSLLQSRLRIDPAIEAT